MHKTIFSSLVGLSLMSGSVPGLAAEPADSIYYDARIYTVNEQQPWAEAVAVRDGRILAVGDEATVLGFKGPDTTMVDLDGAMLMPGIIDGHVHPHWGAQKVLYECNFPFSATPDDITRQVASCVEEQADAVWIQGGQWDSGFFDRFDVPSPRALLDAVSGDKAVFLSDDSGHNAWVNSKALALVGISADTPDPVDGSIQRLPGTNEPNGVLLEGAAQMIEPALPERTEAELTEAAEQSLAIANRVGITGMKFAAASKPTLWAFKELDKQGQVTAHLALSMRTPYGGREERLDYAAYESLRDQFAGEHVDTRFIKIFMDGVPTPSRTAAMIHPYTPEAEGKAPVRGEAHLEPMLLASDLVELDKRGFTVKIHTAGDRAVRIALDAIAAAREANGDSGLRHELAHAGFIDKADLPRFAELNAVADLSPYLWHPSPIMDSVISAVGPEGEHYFPIKSLLEAGAPVLAGSDWPAAVETINPWLGLEAMVTRRHPEGRQEGALWPEQAISLAEAISIFTRSGARALRIEDSAGSIEVGKSADFVVLSSNLFDIEPELISDVRVLRTVFEGDTVYQAADGE